MTRDVSLELNLRGDRKTQQGLKRTADELRKLGDEHEDVETAGKALARAIEQTTDRMIGEIDATARAAVRMHEALGADSDLDARQVVADLKRMGLTAAEVEADAESLARALGRAGDVKTHAAARGFENVGQAVGDVEHEVGRTRDTMTGFIGGTVGELPGISGAMGPVAEGLGQLTEGALEGEVAFKSLAAAGLGMAGVAIVVGEITKHFAEKAALEEWRTEQVDAYTDALADTESTLDAVVAKLSEADGVALKLGGGIELAGDDMVRVFNGVGISVEHFAQLVAGGEQAVAEWADAMRDAGVDGDAVALVTAAAAEESRALAEAQDGAAASAEFFGDATADASETVAEQTERLTAQADALRDTADAYLEQIDAQLAAADASFALRDAEGELLKTVDESTDALTAAGDDLRKRQQVLDDVAQAAGKVAAAEVRHAEETARANGQTLTATQRQDAMNSSLLRSAETARGPARQAIIDYLAAVNGIPADKRTDIEVALARGDIEAAQRIIDTTSRTRRTAIHADAHTADAESKLNYAARDRNVAFRVNVPNAGNVPSWYSKGSTGTRPGMALVGEQGPELVNMPTGTTVETAQRTRELLGGTARGDVHVHLPVGTRPDDTVRALRRYRRIQATET